MGWGSIITVTAGMALPHGKKDGPRRTPKNVALLLVSSKVTLLDSFSSFQIFLSNGPYAWAIHQGTEFIISHTFQFERYFSFACPVKFDSIIGVILLDTVPNIIKLL